MTDMKPFKERAAEALDQLPEGMQERAVAYIFEQAEKYRVLKKLIDEGLADIEAGHVTEWNVDEFLREARAEEK